MLLLGIFKHIQHIYINIYIITLTRRYLFITTELFIYHNNNSKAEQIEFKSLNKNKNKAKKSSTTMENKNFKMPSKLSDKRFVFYFF